MKTELLEYIFEHTSEDCMSDLKDSKNLKPYISYIMKIDDEMYTVEDWKYVYMYLTGKHVEGSVDYIKRLLQEWVK